jgi:hypothetical protein
MASDDLKVTSIYFSLRDRGRWHMVVTHGCMVEDLRLSTENDGPAMLVRSFGIDLARAKRLCKAATVSDPTVLDPATWGKD